jgi:hypothetical protein
VVAHHEEGGSRVVRLQPRPGGAHDHGLDDEDVDDMDDDDDDDEDDDEDDDANDEEDDYRTAQIPPEFTVSPSRFSVTTEYSDDESDGDPHHPRPPGPRRASRHTPNRIGLLAFESDSSDESSSLYRHWPPQTQNDFEREYARRRRRQRYRRTNYQGSEHHMTLEEAQEASQIATQEAVRAVGGGLMAPLAHFFIEKDKNKCTIRFNPPVSARYILLKMWNPHQDPHDGPKNIDIQGVVAKGFAGPRFCPAVELA